MDIQLTPLITALMVGWLGGIHCLGMCGGVVNALSFGLSPRIQQSWWQTQGFQLGYNLGRISAYALAGALMGALGQVLGGVDAFLPYQWLLMLLAGIMMLLLGLYIGGWSASIVVVERLGQVWWQWIQPLAKRAKPVDTWYQAWWYGFLWGWLPCGLVYSALIMALATGSALGGGLLMFAFGLGTLPNLMLMGSFAFFFARLRHNRRVQQLAGVSIVAFSLVEFYYAWSFYGQIG